MWRTTTALALLALFFGDAARGNDQPILSYAPEDQPLFLECRMRPLHRKSPFQDWIALSLFFPDGTGGRFLNVQIIDPKNQLEGGRFRFSLKAKGHWSLIDSEEAPTSENHRDFPQLMFIPPEGPDNLPQNRFLMPRGPANYIMIFGARQPRRVGVCKGTIGTHAANKFAAARTGLKH